MSLEKSNLSDTAKEVFPHLQETYRRLREFKLQDMGEEGEAMETLAEDIKDLVQIANKIIKGEASDSEKIDFKIAMRQIRSAIITDPKITSLPEDKKEKAITIRENIVAKLEDNVLGTEGLA
ncbi:MAG: hypothetical protein V1679_00385 [Candidatus Peregrinibacteria bacterium]